jgi:hypothetical protein
VVSAKFFLVTLFLVSGHLNSLLSLEFERRVAGMSCIKVGILTIFPSFVGEVNFLNLTMSENMLFFLFGWSITWLMAFINF